MSEPEAKVGGLLGYGIICIISGGVVIGMSVPYLTAGKPFGELQNLLAESGASTFANAMNLGLLIVAGGGASLLGGIMSIVASALNKKILGVIAMVLVLASAGLQLYSGITYNSTLSGVYTSMQSNPTATEFTGEEKIIMDVLAVIYNECCFQYDGDSNDNQKLVPKCGATEDETCPPDNANSLWPPIINDNSFAGVIQDVKKMLCTCYSSDESYATVKKVVTDRNLCTVLQDAGVDNADDIVLPNSGGATLGLAVSSIKALSTTPAYQVAELPIGTMYMTGSFLPPADGVDGNGWGCGLGYAKAIGLTEYYYIKNAGDMSMYAAFIGAALGFLSSLFLGLFWFMSSGSNDDQWNDMEGNDARVAVKADY